MMVKQMNNVGSVVVFTMLYCTSIYFILYERNMHVHVVSVGFQLESAARSPMRSKNDVE